MQMRQTATSLSHDSRRIAWNVSPSWGLTQGEPACDCSWGPYF